MARLIPLIVLVTFAAAVDLPPLPFDGLKNFFIGQYTGFMGSPGTVGTRCLNKDF
jgi:hypothetical protein